MPYDPELCAEQTLDMRGWFESAKLQHAALGLTIDEGDDMGDHVGMQRHRRACHDGQAEILRMWEEALRADDGLIEGLQSVLQDRVAELEAALERLRPIIENSKVAFENPPDYNDPSLRAWRLEGLASGCRIGREVIDKALRAE